MFTRDEAAEVFLRRVTGKLYKGGVEITLSYLDKGVKVAHNQRLHRLQKLHKWFQMLSQEDQANVREIVRETAGNTFFELCCLLDGVAGMAVDNYPSDFAVYLQIYEDMDSLLANRPVFSVRVNSGSGEDLHDMVDDFIEEYERTKESSLPKSP
jgi:hypothetical protein